MNPNDQKYLDTATVLLSTGIKLEGKAEYSKDGVEKIRQDLSYFLLGVKGLFYQLPDIGKYFLLQSQNLEELTLNSVQTFDYNRKKELLKGYNHLLTRFIDYFAYYRS
jgi:hypothetical protein